MVTEGKRFIEVVGEMKRETIHFTSDENSGDVISTSSLLQRPVYAHCVDEDGSGSQGAAPACTINGKAITSTDLGIWTGVKLIVEGY